MASALFKTTPPEISGTAERLTMKLLPDVKYHKEARNPKKKIDMTHLFCKVQKRSNSLFSGMQLLDMLASQNFRLIT